MIKQSKIYSGYFNPAALLPNTSDIQQAIISLANREYYIKSVMWDWQARDEATFNNLPIELNTTQQISFSILYTGGTGTPICNLLTPVPLSSLGVNGGAITFFKPGQRHFENFYIFNDILVQFNQTNRDLLNAVRFLVSFIIEVQEI